MQEVLPGVPGASDLPVRAQRLELTSQVTNYKDDAEKIEQDLKYVNFYPILLGMSKI